MRIDDLCLWFFLTINFQKMIFKKTIIKKNVPDTAEINKFYNMLEKMKKKRPNMNIIWIMSNLYGADFIKYIKN